MALPAFDIGELVRLGNHAGTNADGSTRAAFATAAGVATDPTAITLTLKLPDGSLKYYGYSVAGADGVLVRESAGRFYFDYTMAATGTYYWKLAGTGAVVTSEEGALYCRSSRFS